MSASDDIEALLLCPKRILIVKKPGDEIAAGVYDQIYTILKERGLQTVVDQSNTEASSDVERFNVEVPQDNRIDAIVTLGGDGTILFVCQMFGDDRVPPILSFNIGSLGFLTPFAISEVPEAMDTLLNGHMTWMRRTRLMCTLDRKSTAKDDRGRFHVMNEVAVDRGSSAFICQLDCYCNGGHMTTVQGDGIILASATGSTAYNLSAGGPAVHPSLPAIVFTPNCPHSLSFKPVTIPSDVSVDIVVPETARSSAWVTIDGRYRLEMAPGDKVCITESQHPLRTACRSGQSSDWVRSLRECLNWNVRRVEPRGFTGMLEEGNLMPGPV